MDYKVIDNFLPEYIFPEVQETIVRNPEFPWYISPAVARQPGEDGDDGNWNWYASHTFYDLNRPCSPFWEIIDRYFLETFCKEDMCRSFIRAKANFYANKGDELVEHPQHMDYGFQHTAAVFSLNTCDGFTRLADGTKIDSVANRIVFFDGSSQHNSTTCTNQKGRFNINFNFL
jgi:hypothetical protein